MITFKLNGVAMYLTRADVAYGTPQGHATPADLLSAGYVPAGDYVELLSRMHLAASQRATEAEALLNKARNWVTHRAFGHESATVEVLVDLLLETAAPPLSHTCTNTATTVDGQPLPPCPACLADPEKFTPLHGPLEHLEGRLNRDNQEAFLTRGELVAALRRVTDWQEEHPEGPSVHGPAAYALRVLTQELGKI
jgi:hypothetical protein